MRQWLVPQRIRDNIILLHSPLFKYYIGGLKINMEIVWIMFHIEWVGVSFDHPELFSCSWKLVGSSQSFRTSCSDRWGTSLLLWCTRSNYGNFRNCYFIRWDALLLFRCMVPCWSIHTTVVPQSITVNNFRFSSWSQLNSVNQIIDSFGDDMGTCQLQERLERVHEFARGNMQLMSNRMKQRYDPLLEHQPLVAGQAVWLYNPQRKKGLTPKMQCPHTCIAGCSVRWLVFWPAKH